MAHPGWTVSASQRVACAQPEAKSGAGVSEILEGLSPNAQEVVFKIVGSMEGLTHRSHVARYLDLNCNELDLKRLGGVVHKGTKTGKEDTVMR